tara:strand:+ start:4808 stop:5926 length:1119 start_codon:yes stop_codon:yes gene_type:complete
MQTRSLKIIRTSLFLLSLFLITQAKAQEIDSTKTKDDSTAFKLYPLPVVYYTPETRFAFGAVGIASFRLKDKLYSDRNSFFQLGGAYTQEDQLLFYLPYQLFLKDNDYYVFGEFGYYRYSYLFYGVGADLAESNEEVYFVNFPRVRLNATKLIAPQFYFGIRYWFDDYQIKDTEEDGILRNELVNGANGGVISSLGLIGILDKRDHINYPEKGSILEIAAIPNSNLLGSDFNFIKYSVDYSKYLKYKDIITAINLYGVSISGSPPFNEQAFIGGRSKMRGFYEGRYRERNLVMGQLELRKWIGWKLGLVAFSGHGMLSHDLGNMSLSNLKNTYGIGIRYRLNEEDKINIRLDYGRSFDGESSAVYLVVGEAF